MLGRTIGSAGARVRDLRLYVAPGFIAIHVQFARTGILTRGHGGRLRADRERSGAGGSPHPADFPTLPVNDKTPPSPAISTERLATALVNVFPRGPSRMVVCEELAAMVPRKRGAVVHAPTTDVPPYELHSYAARHGVRTRFNIPVINQLRGLHFERGGIREGLESVRLGLRGIPGSERYGGARPSCWLTSDTGLLPATSYPCVPAESVRSRWIPLRMRPRVRLERQSASSLMSLSTASRNTDSPAVKKMLDDTGMKSSRSKILMDWYLDGDARANRTVAVPCHRTGGELACAI